jgi:hypothetical protein
MTEQINKYAPIITQLKEELEILKTHKFQGAKVRSQINKFLQETPSKQYLEIEKDVQHNRQINKILDIKGGLQTQK